MQLHNPGQSIPLWLLSINAGLVKDIATGSAAGPIGAWLVDNNLAKENQEIILNQGGFLARPSILKIFVEAKNDNI
jgi:trans-2,3-dihydro-3-hydroxyanthranilate isomerase